MSVCKGHRDLRGSVPLLLIGISCFFSFHIRRSGTYSKLTPTITNQTLMPEDSSSAAKNGRGKDKKKRSRREFSVEEIEKRRRECEAREALKDSQDQREIDLLDDRDPDQLRRKKELMKKAQLKQRKRNQRERSRINLPSVPFSSAASEMDAIESELHGMSPDEIFELAKQHLIFKKLGF